MAEPNLTPQATPEPQQTATTADLEIVKPENRNDPRYFYLKKPIEVDGRSISYLLLDPDAGGLDGRDLFKLLATYKRRFPDEVRNQTNPFAKYMSENFLSLVIAKLNKIAPEDIFNRVSYKELSQLFPQAAVFQFSDGNQTAPE